VKQVKTLDASSAAMTHSVFDGNNDRRTVNAFNDFRCGNADHTSMPAFTGQNSNATFGVLRFKLDHAHYLLDNRSLDLLTLNILGVELLGEPPRLRFSRCRKQIYSSAGAGHSTDRVYSRTYAKSDVTAGYPGFVFQSDNIKQSAQSAIIWRTQPFKTKLCNDAILSDKRNNIRDSADRDNFQKRFDDFSPVWVIR